MTSLLHKIGLVVYDIGLAGPRVLTFIQIAALFVCRNEHCAFWFHLFDFISYKLLLKLKQQQQQQQQQNTKTRGYLSETSYFALEKLS